MRRAAGVFLCLAGASLFAQSTPVRVVTPSKEAAARLDALPAARISSTRFDPKKVELSRQDRHWRIMNDGKVIKDFGTNEHEARHALHLIQQLGLDEVARVGPGMEYWLAAGKAPTAPTRGLRTVSFDSSALRAEKLHGQWCVRDESRVLCAFGDQEADARRAVEVMRQHHFSEAALLGRGVPVMTVYFTRPTGEIPTLAGSHTTAGSASSRGMPVQRFPRLAKNRDGSEKKQMPPSTGVEAAAPPLVPPVADRVAREKNRDSWRAKPGKSEPVVTGGRVAFDWRQVHLNEGADCSLSAGSKVLARFGENAGDARIALSALRYYRCTEHLAIPTETAGHWFIAPQVAPRGVMFGLNAEPVRPEKMQVVRDGDRFALAEGTRVVVPMGASAEDAARLLETMRKLHVDRITRLGLPGPQGVAFLLRSK